jgi:2-methylaconitate cis-trans-isomerase PrpF
MPVLSDSVPVRCSILRGGTSKAVFFLANDLPPDRPSIEPVLKSVFGSPDIRQIDGLGGATSQTSKAAIIGPPSRPDADVDYTFAQVSVGEDVVDWGGNCGHISAAVGPFAIDQGFVRATEPITTVRVHNTNTNKIILEHVPVCGGRAASEGEYSIPGVPGTSARILLEFSDPSGSVTGKLLPTGRPRDQVTLDDGRTFDVSVVDAGNPVVFVAAEALGFSGTELPLEVEANVGATDTLEAIRSVVACWMGLVTDPHDATRVTPGLPKVGYVARPMAYTTTAGVEIPEGSIDLTGRLMSMQTAHRSYMATGAIATGAAAFVEGTIVNELVRPIGDRPIADSIRIGHPSGVMAGVLIGAGVAAAPVVRGIAVGRTARHILDGQVWVPRRLVSPR